MLSSGDMVVRPISSADVAKIRELHSLVLPVEYPSSFFTQLLLLPARICLMAYHVTSPNSPIAFISAYLQHTPRVDVTPFLPAIHELPITAPCLEILSLGVLPEFQKRGLASLLVHHIYDHFRRCSSLNGGTMVHANVATSNVPALSFYKRLGICITSDVIHNLYRGCKYGSRDAYFVAGYITI